MAPASAARCVPQSSACEAQSTSLRREIRLRCHGDLAEAIQGLVHHMRTEQQMIRDWVDSQAAQQREIKKLLEVLVREHAKLS